MSGSCLLADLIFGLNKPPVFNLFKIPESITRWKYKSMHAFQIFFESGEHHFQEEKDLWGTESCLG